MPLKGHSVSAQLSSDAVSALRKVRVLNVTVEATSAKDASTPGKKEEEEEEKREKKEFRLDSNDFGFI